MASLYIHIPFCHKLCPYCDFATVAIKKAPEKEYVTALKKELLSLKEGLSKEDTRCDTIFWGGGTPSFFSPEAIEEVHDAINSAFQIDWENSEVTLEGNPNDFSKSYAKGLKSARVNRVSLGAQSLNDEILKTLGREHSAKDIHLGVENTVQGGITNVSLDLIFGVPEQSLEDVTEDISNYLRMPITHVSCYSLTFEAGTPFYQARESGALTPLPDENVRTQYLQIIHQLLEAGFKHYEISNFSKEGFSCRHNENYWQRGSYFGIGAGAHSFLKSSEQRWANVSSPTQYMKLIGEGASAKAWSEEVGESEQLSESVLLSLRTAQGIHGKILTRLQQSSNWSTFKESLEEFQEEGLLHRTDSTITLTEEGFCIADSLIENLVGIL